jgi:hypothetical protein
MPLTAISALADQPAADKHGRSKLRRPERHWEVAVWAIWRPSFNEDFFQSCIDFASRQSTLQPKKIGEIGTMCVTMYFKLSEQNLRP